MIYTAFQSLCRDESSQLDVRYVYSPAGFPSFGIGVRFKLDADVLEYEVLHLLSQDGSKPCGDSDDVNVLTNILDVPLEVRELGCLIERKLRHWKGSDDINLDFSELGGSNAKYWRTKK